MAVSVVIFLYKPWYIAFNPLFITGIGVACLVQAALNSAPLRSRAVHWLSEISFSVYLCHLAIIALVKDLVSLPAPAAVGLVLGLTLSMAWITYWTIEKPAMSYGRRLTRRTNMTPGKPPTLFGSVRASP